LFLNCSLKLHQPRAAVFDGTTEAATLLPMLTTISVILVILWLLGLITSYTIGGFIHILLVVAIIIVLLRIIQGRRVL
jgi:hypothetical protein